MQVEQLEEVRIRQSDLHNVYAALSNAARESSIAPFQAGALIHELLEVDGCVTAKAFLEWWVAEDAAEALSLFMAAEFEGRASLLERSTSHNFRYRIRLEEAAAPVSGSSKLDAEEAASSLTHSALSEVFSKFEASKTRLRIQEYSVGQTTLEQIFNQFAAQQDNPEVAAILASNAAASGAGSRSNSRSYSSANRK